VPVKLKLLRSVGVKRPKLVSPDKAFSYQALLQKQFEERSIYLAGLIVGRSITEAAEISGVHRSSLYRMLTDHGITVSRRNREWTSTTDLFAAFRKFASAKRLG
jgi:hypothetical protein